MDRLCYEQCLQFLERGQQVIVFTHSRKGTMELCSTFFNYASSVNRAGVFKPEESVAETHEYRLAVKEVGLVLFSSRALLEHETLRFRWKRSRIAS